MEKRNEGWRRGMRDGEDGRGMEKRDEGIGMRDGEEGWTRGKRDGEKG